MTTMLTHAEYTRRLNSAHHGNILCLGTYSGASVKIKHKCALCGHIWSTQPASLTLPNHVCGCPKCAYRLNGDQIRGKFWKNTKEHKLDVKVKHGDSITVLDAYQGISTPIRYRCTNCKSILKTTPSRILRLQNVTCCSRYPTQKLTTAHYLEKLQSVGSLMRPEEEYTSRTAKMLHRCLNCGTVKALFPNNLLNGTRCTTCRETPISEYVEKARAANQNCDYDYSALTYKPTRGKIEIICKLHGPFKVSSNYHLRGYGCRSCHPANRSKPAIDWIEKEAYSRRMKNVQHANNGGEFTLPGTKIRVDGYHASTKTVFEFHGSYWHGDPKKFKAGDRNHFSIKSARQLYRETLDRDKTIRSMGYRLVVMWESDYLS